MVPYMFHHMLHISLLTWSIVLTIIWSFYGLLYGPLYSPYLVHYMYMVPQHLRILRSSFCVNDFLLNVALVITFGTTSVGAGPIENRSANGKCLRPQYAFVIYYYNIPYSIRPNVEALHLLSTKMKHLTFRTDLGSAWPRSAHPQVLPTSIITTFRMEERKLLIIYRMRVPGNSHWVIRILLDHS